MADVIKRAILFNGKAIVDILDTTQLVQDAINYHKLSDSSAEALGKVLTIGSFISSGFKGKDNKLTLIIQGNGEGGKIVVCGDTGAFVRGYIENKNANCNTTSEVVGKKGYLSVIKDFNMKEPYNGYSELVNGNIDSDFAYYFTTSEQLPSAISLQLKIKDGVCIKSAGIIVQPMPNCTEEELVVLEDIVNLMKNIADLIEEKGIEEVLNFYFGHFDISILPDVHPKYKCSCSTKRIDAMLLTLGKKEANDIVDKEGKIEIGCQFCDKKYIYTKEDLGRVFNGE